MANETVIVNASQQDSRVNPEETTDRRRSRAAQQDIWAEALESLSPLSLVIGVIAAFAGYLVSALGLVLIAAALIEIAIGARGAAARNRELAEENEANLLAQEQASNRTQAIESSFVVTDERLSILRSEGAGRDLILALRRSGDMPIPGAGLVNQLDERLGIKRTNASLPLVLEYLVDRRAEVRR